MAPLAASPASFQPSNAATSTGLVSVGQPSNSVTLPPYDWSASPCSNAESRRARPYAGHSSNPALRAARPSDQSPTEDAEIVPAAPSVRPDATDVLSAALTLAHPGARRRDGHDDPAAHLQRGGVPRRAVRRLAQRPQGQQRPADPHPARSDQRHPPGLPRSRGRPDRDQHLQRAAHLAGRLRHAGPRLRAQLRVGPAGPGRVRRGDGGRTRPSRASSSGRSGRPTAPRRSRRTSTTRAPATSPTSNSSTPTSSRRTGWSTAAPTC